MAISVAPPRTRLISEEELLYLSAGDQWYEVVEGEAVPVMAAGFLHILVIRAVFRILDAFTTEHRLGDVFPDGLHYILFADAEGIRGSRIPDVSFIRKGRISKGFDLHRPFPGAPDLAVEVASPDETAQSILAKVNDFLTAGTEQVWVIYPDAKTIHQYRRDDPKTIRVHSGEDHIEAESLFPGLKLPVGELFATPEEE